MSNAETELAGFVHDALARGLPRAEIERALAEAGWSDAQVRSALARYAEVAFPVPVPRPRRQPSARETFLHLVLFSMLGLSAWYFGTLVFALIDMALPDPALDHHAARLVERSLRWSIAALVVAFPTYLFLAVRTEAESARWTSGARRWLTYATLFVAALVIVGDLIGLVFQFLSGELTMRVALKFLTVGVIAGAIFAFYLRSAARDPAER